MSRSRLKILTARILAVIATWLGICCGKESEQLEAYKYGLADSFSSGYGDSVDDEPREFSADEAELFGGAYGGRAMSLSHFERLVAATNADLRVMHKQKE